MSEVNAKIICDSTNAFQTRLTTIQIRIPKFLLAEFNTHRVFCLDKDTEVWFDMPSGCKKGKKKVYKRTIEDLYKMYHGTVSRKPKIEFANLDQLDVKATYSTKEIANICNVNRQHVRHFCLGNKIPYLMDKRDNVKVMMIKAADFIDGVESKVNCTSYKFAIEKMNVRQVNTDTNKITHSTIDDVIYSGKQPVYKVTLDNGKEITLTENHRILGANGYFTLADYGLTRSDAFVAWAKDIPLVATNGSASTDGTGGLKRRLNPNTLKDRKVDAKNRSLFLNSIRLELMEASNYTCAVTGRRNKLEMHHVDPVWHNKARAFDKTNIVVICKEVHKLIHSNHLDLHFLEYRQSGKDLSEYLNHLPSSDIAMASIGKPATKVRDNVKFSKIVKIEYVGVRDTYDLSIAGDFPNFIANGICVHNSRSFNSSRAVPSKVFRLSANFQPDKWLSNQSGMVGGAELTGLRKIGAIATWNSLTATVKFGHWLLELCGLHKQYTNRWLEPIVYADGVITSTDWINFLNLRNHPAAQPEIKELASQIDQLLRTSDPNYLLAGEWHLPYIDADDHASDYSIEQLRMISAGRCARVSYGFKDGKDSAADLRRAKRLLDTNPVHASPFEHIALAPAARGKDHTNFKSGNLRNWIQYRKMIEAGIST